MKLHAPEGLNKSFTYFLDRHKIMKVSFYTAMDWYAIQTNKATPECEVNDVTV